MNFTLCKNRCNYTKRNKQSRNPPLSVQPFQTRTIPRPAPSPLPYERSVGFASLQSPWAFNFGHPCPSLVKGEVLSPEKIRATTGGIATSLLPKPHYTSKSTISLPPLSKVRCCRPKEFGRLPEGLLFYRTLSVSQTPPLTIPQSQ